jgi:cholesterol oxidase
MKPDAAPFARGLGELWADYDDSRPFDVLIVGSGYGGSVAAAGLAGCSDASGRKLRVGLLERGRHYLPGEFPARFADLPGHVRLARQASGVVHGHEGLLDMRLGEDVMALVANGLGGGSLINAGVLLEPSSADFPGEQQAPWRGKIEQLRRDGYFQRALEELGGFVSRGGKGEKNTIGRHADVQCKPLDKNLALRALAAKAGGSTAVVEPPVTVAFDHLQPNSAGVRLPRCTLCGDCLTGCNVGAKDSLDANLLMKARRNGAELYTGATVTSIALENKKELPCWVVRVAHTLPSLQERENRLLLLRAHVVVLAAGTLGSSEILLRSRGESLCFSARLGERFSCNGDNIAAVHRMPRRAHASADEDAVGPRRVGPTITATFAPSSAPRGFQVQEFAVPAPLKRLFDEVVTTASTLHGLPQRDCEKHERTRDDKQPDPLSVDPQHMEHTLLVGVIGHDAAAGSLRLPRPVRPQEGPPASGVVSIHWPDARYADALNVPHRALRDLVGALGRPATLVANPLWRLLPSTLERLVLQPRGPVLTVHPLGGCGIGQDVLDGVVDANGCVFDAAAGARRKWQGKLLVLDGAIVPGSLGVNPSLTITALAMRGIDALRTRESWRGGIVFGQADTSTWPVQDRDRVDPPAGAPEIHPPAPATTIEVIERLVGEAQLKLPNAPTRRCMVELTLAYQAVGVRDLLRPLRRTVPVDGASRDTRLRIYDFDVWKANHLRVVSDEQRQRFVEFEAELSGELHFLHRDASHPWGRVLRATWAWLWNRGTRDIYQELRDKLTQWSDRRERDRRRALRRTEDEPTPGYVRGLIAVATHAGEVRRFDYCLNVGRVTVHRGAFTAADGQPVLPKGARIVGDKRLTYNRRANPWQQLTRLTLREMPWLDRQAGRPVLELDPGFMAGIGVPLLRIASQRDQASALADLGSFALQVARILIYTHLWTFRKPDHADARPVNRLPGIVQGIAPQVSELVVDRMKRGSDEPVTIRLSRYLPPRPQPLPALVMIHGYSVSGNTFTHETLRPSAAGYFLDRGREVWVVDLRTSAGLPSATQPWAFEQAALIDLPAALLHVKSVTGREVDVLAHCIGCAMLGMAILSDAREIARNEQQLGVHTWLTSEHLGLLNAFNGVRPAGGPHPTVGRIVLSQKGPVLRYTDANILRAYLMQWLRRIVLSDDYQFRPPERPTLSDELLDRLLSSLPYPKEDYDVENPPWPCSRTGWTTTRHRMDALYGRDFDAANVDADTRHAIDDLFGPINLDTVAQTAHFARFCMITNQAGRGEFVTRRRLRERWGGIPTLAIHGNDNGLADVDTQRLLERHLKGAGVPFEARSYAQMGHQDVLIGKRSYEVFEDIDRFLGAKTPDATPDVLPPFAFDAPWIGPRIATPPSAGSALTLAAMPRPDQGRARLALVPGRRNPPGTGRRFEPIELEHGVAMSQRGASGEWLFAEPDLGALGGADGAAYGFFAILVYDVDETTAFQEPAWPLPLDAAGAPPAASGAARGMRRPAARDRPAAALPAAQFQDEADDELADAEPAPASAAQPFARPLPARTARGAPEPSDIPQHLPRDARAWLRERADSVLARCFVRLDDLVRARRNLRPDRPRPDFAFALASCQYPHGLADRRIAGATYVAMHRTLEQVQLALLVGDQIYADATAGLLDATRSDERYDAPHDRALRVQGLRAVMRRVPVLTLPDDHELVDNWEPLAAAAAQARPLAQRKRAEAHHEGLRAFYDYQRMARPPHTTDAADLAVNFGGHPFYLLDTRTRRLPRSAKTAADRMLIMEPAQWRRLQDWLTGQPVDAVKFVATSALLLPRHRAVVADARQSARQDGWGGYPMSLHRLIDFIAEHDIRHTVFLSGDEHHALFCEAWLGRRRVKLVSVHSSASYAPFAFANGRPQDLKAREVIEPPRHFKARALVKTTFAPTGDGFAQIAVEPAHGGAPPALRITFYKADGGGVCYRVPLA